MPWSKPKLTELRDSGPPAFVHNNLAADGLGRYAYAAGHGLVVTHRAAPVLGALEYYVSTDRDDRERAAAGKDVTAVFWWEVDDKKRLLVAAVAAGQEDPPRIVAWDVSGAKPVLMYQADVDAQWLEVAAEMDAEAKAAQETRRGQHQAEHAVGDDDDDDDAEDEADEDDDHSEQERDQGDDHDEGADPNENAQEISFIAGFAAMTKQEPLLFLGTSTGHVFGFGGVAPDKAFELAHCLGGFPGPVSSLTTDRSRSPFLAAGDEKGKVIVWDSVKDWAPVYQAQRENDTVTALGLRDQVLVVGHASGVITTHHLETQRCSGKINLNARSVTFLDVHPLQDVILVGGADCRVAVCALPGDEKKRVTVLLSLCFSAVPVGGVFSGLRDDETPDVAMSFAERNYLVHYEYVRNAAGSGSVATPKSSGSLASPRRFSFSGPASPRLSEQVGG
mmetsp:Transcript_51830/g.127207  ORF Transcript_51830/g.127207 Transcript_51830/m.127207 type:complete len:448 (-) Transcript_51830:83-1426(-)